jgi:enoyl-CoA hydratase
MSNPLDFLSYQTLHFERDGGVLTVTFNSPETANAFGPEMEGELRRFLFEVPTDKQTKVIILTGAGKTFSAGGDLDEMRKLIDKPELFYPSLHGAKQLVTLMLDCPQPIISKINGHAIGLGATVALFADITFAAEHAKIADPHVLVGFVAGDGGSVIWPQLVGLNKAKEYLFTGDSVPAPEAERLGLINHCVPAEELDERVNQLAQRIANGAARAIQWTKATINIGIKQAATATMDAGIAFEALSNSTRDHREALEAMTEKRKPEFTGD